MRLALHLPFRSTAVLRPMMQLVNGMMRTRKSHAHLRMMEVRGTVSATMIYDHRPIRDAFREVDEHTVIGLMDYRDTPQLFIFMLRRDTSAL